MRFSHWLWSAVAAALYAGSAHAQRAGENAAAAAADAFGTAVGNESFGLYDPYDARGFSPVQAGNVRIEGLYFDQQSDLGGRVVSGNTVHVGISAQAYAFPAPTGIADFSLRLPGDKPLTSVFFGYGVYDTLDLEIDSQFPVVTNKLSVGVGARISRYDNDQAVKNPEWETGALARFRPGDDSEVVGFFDFTHGTCCREQPLVFPAGPYLPTEWRRRTYWGQSWTGNDWTNENFGAIVRTSTWGDWNLRAGIFRSVNANNGNFGDFLTNVQPDGRGDDVVVQLPPQLFASTSGEARLTRVVDDDGWRHTFNIALRGRDVQRYFGGADSVDLGPSVAGLHAPVSPPTFDLGPTTNDHAQQGTGGLAYDGLWAGVGEFGVGVQKTIYHRDIAQPGLPRETSSSTPLLYNGTVSVFVTKALALYGSYTRGLEESGTAPSNAANPNEAMPASITRQIDAGLRYVFTPSLKFVVGVFEVDKPYFNLNAANVYGALGTIRHRGVELSVAGNVTDDVSIVGGMLLLEPRISGEPVDRGIVKPAPPGISPRFGLLSITYHPQVWAGLALDAQIYNSAGQPVLSTDDFHTPGWTEINLGARYNFNIGTTPASIRVQAVNVANFYGWNVNESGSVTPRGPRRFLANFTADF